MGSSCSSKKKLDLADEEPIGDHHSINGEIQYNTTQYEPSVIDGGGVSFAANEKSPNQLVVSPGMANGHRVNDQTKLEDLEETKDNKSAEKRYKIMEIEGDRLVSEPLRLILCYAEVPYDEETLTKDNWPKTNEENLKSPALQYDDTFIGGEIPAARYLAGEHDLLSEEEFESGKMDMLMEIFVKIREPVLPVLKLPGFGKDSGDWQNAKEEITQYLKMFEKRTKEATNGWFVGGQVSWVDLTVSDFLAVLWNKVDADLLNDYPSLRKHIESIRCIPSIQEYIESRKDVL